MSCSKKKNKAGVECTENEVGGSKNQKSQPCILSGALNGKVDTDLEKKTTDEKLLKKILDLEKTIIERAKKMGVVE